MKVIGITGGVGAGKSEVLQYISGQYNCRVIYADEVANRLKLPGNECYEQLVRLLGDKILCDDGHIDHKKMADVIFLKEGMLQKVNSIIHPAVKDYFMAELEKERCLNRIDFLFIEAALLIECGYRDHVDEIWYIYAAQSERERRLMQSRSYSVQKIAGIMEKQLRENEFRSQCDRVIDNSGDFEYTKNQIDRILGDERWKMQKNIRGN